ncbi:MAG: ribonuclease HII [Candidatus Komeilibacteria bacterium]|nr:ribonuclease HII [Candidatus Komeilibacteria bacterium]
MRTNNKLIAGVDEVGRGAWAGPLVAAAVIFRTTPTVVLKDSKLLSFEQRQQLAIEIKKFSWWAVGVVSNLEIDKYGLQPANILAARRAIDNLPCRPTALRLDMIRGFTHRLPYQLIIDGDNTDPRISAASIIAKDYRDQMMIDFHRHYNQYDFHRHKGYGTACHRERLNAYGLSVLHRTSFAPCAQYRR